MRTALCLILIASAAHAAARDVFDVVPGQWWSPVWAAKWAAIIVGGFGCLLGTLGGLTEWLTRKGKARDFILGAWIAMVSVAAVSLVAGIVALVVRQPYFVYGPLLLAGFIGTVVGGRHIRVVRMRYDEAELRKMSAQDTVGTHTAR